MRPFSRLARPIFWLQMFGILLLMIAVMVLQLLLPLPIRFNAQSLAKGLVFAGAALMLPATMTIVWRTLQSWMPGRRR